MLNITSESNKHIKRLKQLSKKKYRQKLETFLVEGIRICELMLVKPELIKAVYISDDALENPRIQGIIEGVNKASGNAFSVDTKLFKQVALTDTPQGIICEMAMPKYNLEEILNREKLRVVIMDRVQDPGNMGTIIRTADSAGFDAVLVMKGSVDVYNDKSLRSTMGSIITMPIIEIDSVDELSELASTYNMELVATDLNTDKYHFEASYSPKTAVIVGNEGSGVDQSLLDISAIRVKIPMIGSAESLNVSVASGIVIYEIVKQDIIQKI